MGFRTLATPKGFAQLWCWLIEMSERDVIDYCSAGLAGYKKPRKVVFVDELPRTASQKIIKYNCAANSLRRLINRYDFKPENPNGNRISHKNRHNRETP